MRLHALFGYLRLWLQAFPLERQLSTAIVKSLFPDQVAPRAVRMEALAFIGSICARS
jgi:hypothetical protein